eukprot:TRINITY_DN9253_c0_g1_i1.p1 TRINITY_DN9253_c0_g1~~TRINITY_DN9253_c0_g1_i1.p1  ORF type:complete len:124 (-),score=16.80 TRINITY_DN9253_c0_g1_i1:8-379(-)
MCITETPGIHDAGEAPQPVAAPQDAAIPSSNEPTTIPDAPKSTGLSFVPGVLSEEHLRSLAGSESVKFSLKDPGLQQTIMSIVNAVEPGKALLAARQDPNFEEFITQMIKSTGAVDQDGSLNL